MPTRRTRRYATWHVHQTVNSCNGCTMMTALIKIIRPPGTNVPDGLMFYPWCLIFFSPRFLRDPSTYRSETLPHDRNLVVFYKLTSKIRGFSPKKFGGQNMQNFGQFWTTSDFDREYVRNEATHPKSKRRTNYGHSCCVWWKKSGELWSTNGLELHVGLDPIKCTFWHTVSRPLGGAAPWNLYTR